MYSTLHGSLDSNMGVEVVTVHYSHPIVSSSTSVSLEVDCGIPNPACQDDSMDNKSDEQPKLRRPEARAQNLATNGVKDPTKLQPKNKESAKTMDSCGSRVYWKILANALIALSVLICLAFLEFGPLPQGYFGFYCEDPKISYTFEGDTISLWMLLVGCLMIPIFVMWCIEWTCYNSDTYGKSPDCTGTRGQRIWSWYGNYIIGLSALLFICEVAKIVVAEPRPHFLDTCRPRESVNCTTSFYIPSYTCTNTERSRRIVQDSSRSFPSGHSAFGAFSATFIVCYLQVRMPTRASTIIVKPLLQCFSLVWFILCALTRITDHRHHWWDVLVGSIMGLFFAIYTVTTCCATFSTQSNPLRNLSESDQHQYLEKKHRSVRQLLSDTSVDIPESRELGNVPSSWNGRD